MYQPYRGWEVVQVHFFCGKLYIRYPCRESLEFSVAIFSVCFLNGIGEQNIWRARELVTALSAICLTLVSFWMSLGLERAFVSVTALNEPLRVCATGTREWAAC
jgi:hypothetical protein